MWVELMCGLVIYRLVRRFFSDDSDILSDSDSTPLFSVSNRYLLWDGQWTQYLLCLLAKVAEAKAQVAILEAYLDQREVALPEGFLSRNVVCPNPNFRTINPSCFPSEVVTHEQWLKLKPEQKSVLSGWIKGAFHSTKKETQESIQQNLGFVLTTASIWDSSFEASGSILC